MKRLLLIDLSGIFWSAWHATADQDVGAAFELTVTRVRQLSDGYDYVACCCDRGPYFRKELSPEYKAQRDAPPENAVAQLRRVKARIDSDGVLLWEVQGFEADDIIATAAEIAAALVPQPMAVTIASNDKDLLQLVSDTDSIRVVSTTNGDMYDEAAVIEKWGVAPHMIADLLALTGDKSDNVPGVPGVGPKTAAKLLEAWGDCDGVIANCDKLQPERFRVPVMQGASGIRLARKLVELRRDVPIKWEDLFRKRETKRITEEPDMSDIDDTDETPDTQPPPAVEVVEVSQGPAPDQSKDETAITVAKQNGNGHGVQVFEHGLQPGTLGAAYKLARGLHESRLYSRLPNPEAIWAIIIRGREMGLGALTALDSFHVVEGRPAPGAHLLVSRAKTHPDCEYFQFIGGDATYAEYETKNKRNPRPTRLKYTIDQAKCAGLLETKPGKQPGNWTKRPDEMLRKTAAVQLARLEYPEALLGAYSAEELEGV